MRPHARASLLWGAIGGLCFLVLAQGYRLVASLPVGTLGLVAIAVGVGVVAAGLSHVAEGRLGWSERA